MLKIEKTVFISYRRTNIGFALAIHQNLTSRGYDVFFDYESIGAGDFEQIILRSIESRAHFVVILTPSALERCKEPGDWLRREIEHALHHQRNIIPLTFEGFDFKDMAKYLPDHIATPLSRYNGLSAPMAYFSESMAKLSDRMKIPLDAVLHPPSAAVQMEEARQQRVIAAEPTVRKVELNGDELLEHGNGKAFILQRDFERALPLVQQATNLNPNFAEAYSSHAWVNTWLKLWNELLAGIKHALKLQPNKAEVYINRGNAKADNGDYDGAIADYNEALRLKPDYALAYNNLGLAKSKKGDILGAFADYDHAIRLKPDDAHAYNNRGWAKYLKGDYEGAMVDCEKAIRLNPDYAEAYHSLGAAKNKQGNLDGAIADFDQAIRLKPDLATYAYHDRGSAKLNKADIRGAIADYQKYLDLGGDKYVGTKAEVEQIIRDLQKRL